jgi:hypothetical protein
MVKKNTDHPGKSNSATSSSRRSSSAVNGSGVSASFQRVRKEIHVSRMHCDEPIGGEVIETVVTIEFPIGDSSKKWTPVAV